MLATDVIGIGSGVLALSEFTTKTVLSVYHELAGFEGNQKSIRDTKRDLEAFTEVLSSLDEIAKNDSISLPNLKIPLTNCAEDCEKFKKLIISCTSDPSNGISAFRDWAELHTKEDEIAAFKDKLTRYKSTITLALCGANLRIVGASAKVLNEVEELVKETKLELEEQFSKLESRLRVLAAPRASNPTDEATERKWIQEEQENTKKWLATLAQISEHINRARSDALADLSVAQKSRYTEVATLADLISATRTSSTGLRKVSGDLAKITNKLEDHLQEINDREQNFSLPKFQVSSGNKAARQAVQKEQVNILSSLSICDGVAEQVETVRTNIFERVSAGPNSFLMVASTIGDLISARNVTTDEGANILLGQMSDATIQQFSCDRAIAPHSVQIATANGNARRNGAEDMGARSEEVEVTNVESKGAVERSARGEGCGLEDGPQNEILYNTQYGKGRVVGIASA